VKILTLGGTIFFGREFVKLALESGHELTVFHRGRHGADLFPEARHVIGDRDGGLSALPDENWDVVLDSCGFVPRVVREAVQTLKARVDRYAFVSTISVYSDAAKPFQTEDGQLGVLSEPTEEITGETYGPLKVLCENEVTSGFGDNAFIVRPGLIVGPYDQSNRFPYWVEQFATTDRVLVPNRPDQPLQMIDSRDLARFTLQAIERGLSGTYHAAGPDSSHTFEDMIDACRTLNPSAQPIWTNEEEIAARGLELWNDLPLSFSAAGESDGLLQIDNSKAVAAGLKFTPWETTAEDTWEWLKTQPADRPRPHGSKTIVP
jgi:2'-hydroxyisoflavone reductase